jgi:hypothetical protein
VKTRGTKSFERKGLLLPPCYGNKKDSSASLIPHCKPHAAIFASHIFLFLSLG